MKKSILVVFALMSMYFLSSCQKEDINDLIGQIANSANKTSVEPEELPNTIVEFIDNNYFETYIEEAWEASGLGYELKMGNDEVVYFDSTNEFLEPSDRGRKGRRGRGHGHHSGPCGGDRGGEQVALADLPTNITDYVATNYPDSEIKRAKSKEDGRYIVGLTGKIVLVFDADGNFVEELPFVSGSCGCGGAEIDVADLPTSITDYITTNYPTAEIKKAHRKVEKYVVGLIVDDERVILIFDADGNFVAERT